MDPKLLILKTVDEVGTLRGRTTLQKICYFAEVTVGLDLDYRPHLYGPYSPVVSSAATDLVQSNFLSDTVESGRLAFPRRSIGGIPLSEWSLHKFAVTPDGETYLSWAEARSPEEFAGIRETILWLKSVTGLKQQSLATFAKVNFLILRGGSDEPARIVQAGAKLGWNLSYSQVAGYISALRAHR